MGELQKELAFFFYSSISLIPESVLHWCYCDHSTDMSLYWWFTCKFLLKDLFLSSNFKIIDLEATKYLYYFKLKSIWILEMLFWQMAKTSKQANKPKGYSSMLTFWALFPFFLYMYVIIMEHLSHSQVHRSPGSKRLHSFCERVSAGLRFRHGWNASQGFMQLQFNPHCNVVREWKNIVLIGGAFGRGVRLNRLLGQSPWLNPGGSEEEREGRRDSLLKRSLSFV